MNRSPQRILIAFVTALLLAPLAVLHAANNDPSRTRIATWTESWLDADGQPKPREVKGEIWTTLATGAKDSNGNQRGASSKKDPVPGTHGVILLHNVRNATVRNVTVRQSRPFAIHLGNIREFTVDGLTLDRHGRDGVHVGVPASDGIIRNIRGDSHDDPVSLTAWDWRQYSVTFGPMHHLTIEHITGAPENKHSTDAIRLLPGVKLGFPLPADYRLIELGPKSQTYKHKPDDPTRWTEIFSPDLDCTVRNVSITGVRPLDSPADLPIEQVVKVIEQKPNPDYPQTTPKGGTGKGIWIR